MIKFLIAVDGSEHSNRAIAAVARLARETSQVEVTLLNVNCCLHAPDDPPSDLLPTDVATQSHQAHILEHASALTEQQGLALQRVVAATGMVAQEIVHAAIAAGVDQIVMGAQGTKARGQYVLGSVAQRVLQLATVPVTLVK